MKPTFHNHFSALERELIHTMASIEKADENACANCGGEDCICCEIYHDRQKWVEPTEMFEGLRDDPFYADRFFRPEEFEEDEEWEDEE